jgi:hypothetical protein
VVDLTLEQTKPKVKARALPNRKQNQLISSVEVVQEDRNVDDCSVPNRGQADLIWSQYDSADRLTNRLGNLTNTN